MSLQVADVHVQIKLCVIRVEVGCVRPKDNETAIVGQFRIKAGDVSGNSAGAGRSAHERCGVSYGVAHKDIEWVVEVVRAEVRSQ